MKKDLKETIFLIICYAFLTALFMWAVYFSGKALWLNLHSDNWWVGSHILAILVGIIIGKLKDVE